MTMKTTILTHRRPFLDRLVYVLLMTSKLIAGDVIITRQMWRDSREHEHVISNSSGIDFIYGYIHGRSCKKPEYSEILELGQ